MGKLSKRDFVTVVSKRTNLRRDVVEDVFDGIIDTAIEEIVNNGGITVKDLFSVTSREWGEYVGIDGQVVAPHKRLSIKLSEKIRKFWKMKSNDFPDTGYLSREQLEEALKYTSKRTTEKPQSKGVSKPAPVIETSTPSVSIQSDQDEYYNPMLDEDD